MTERFNNTNWRPPVINHGKDTLYGWRVDHPGKFKMGNFTDIGYGTYINAKYGLTMGDNVQIGSHCALYTINTIDGTNGEIIIHKGVKIGAHSIIFPGVVLGEGVKIGAMSIVKDSVFTPGVYVGKSLRRLK